MTLNKIVTIIFLGIAFSNVFSEEEDPYLALGSRLMKEERIGDLRIDLPEKDVKKMVPCTLKRGPDQLWGADGLFHQEWVYADCGITLDMSSKKRGAPKSVASLTAIDPSTLNTKRGIHVGSTEQEVMKAYKPFWNKEESEQHVTFQAGSIYGGMIFNFKNGKVSQIFLGAGAE
jgi:hypothetical protein